MRANHSVINKSDVYEIPLYNQTESWPITDKKGPTVFIKSDQRKEIKK